MSTVQADPRAFRAGDHLRGHLVRTRSGRLSLRVDVRVVVTCLGLVAVVVALGAFALTQGTVKLGVGDVWSALTGGGSARARKVVIDIRLPRLVTGVFVGACLGTSGAVFQSISRNVLGSPDIVGFTSGAATGAIVQIIFFGGGALATSTAAVCGGLGAALLVYLLSLKGRAAGGYRLVLVGIGLGAMLGSVNALLLTRSDPDAAVTAQLWLVGSLNARTWAHAVPVIVITMLIVPVLGLLASRLQIMEMGDDVAHQLGLAVERTRVAALIGGVCLVAVATAATGPIAFVALAAAPLVRGLTRAPGAPVVPAAFMGAALLVAADLAGQRLPLKLAMPVGLMTGLLGGIYLIFLLTRSRSV